MYVPGCYFFFFQAEDGIRDLTVTGVQTCALPISRSSAHADKRHSDFFPAGLAARQASPRTPALSLEIDRKSTRLNSSHSQISYAVFCLKKKKKKQSRITY